MCMFLVAMLIELRFRHLMVLGSGTLAMAWRVNQVAIGEHGNIFRHTHIGKADMSRARYVQCAICHLFEAIPVILRFASTIDVLTEKTVK